MQAAILLFQSSVSVIDILFFVVGVQDHEFQFLVGVSGCLMFVCLMVISLTILSSEKISVRDISHIFSFSHVSLSCEFLFLFPIVETVLVSSISHNIPLAAIRFGYVQ